MNKKLAMLTAVVACACATVAFADQPILVGPAFPVAAAPQPVLTPIPAPTPVAAPVIQPVPMGQPIPAQGVAPLFTNVRVRNERRIACNSVPMIVSIADPCACKDKCACRDKCSCCAPPAPQCVNVQICAPACMTCPPKVTCKKDGGYVRYDFDGYRVEVKSKKGYVEVAYH